MSRPLTKDFPRSDEDFDFFPMGLWDSNQGFKKGYDRISMVCLFVCLSGCHLERTGGVCVLEEIISPGGRGWFGLQSGGRELEE